MFYFGDVHDRVLADGYWCVFGGDFGCLLFVGFLERCAPRAPRFVVRAVDRVYGRGFVALCI